MADMQREEWLSLMLRELPDRLLILDEHGCILESFGGALQAPSYSTEKLDQTFSDLVPPTVAKQLQQSLTQTIKSGVLTKLRVSVHQQVID